MRTLLVALLFASFVGASQKQKILDWNADSDWRKPHVPTKMEFLTLQLNSAHRVDSLDGKRFGFQWISHDLAPGHLSVFINGPRDTNGSEFDKLDDEARRWVKSEQIGVSEEPVILDITHVRLDKKDEFY